MDNRETSVPRPDRPEFRRLFVRCSAEAVAVPLDRVDEVLVPQPFTRVPGSGPEVCGLIGLRGRVLTVFDLCAMLGGPPIDPRDDFRILVVRAADRVVGLAVAEVATNVDDTADQGGGEAWRASRVRKVLDLDRLIGSMLA